mgnify:CR=1 FL=1
MATYIHRDISSTFSGDIELDTKGDLKLADALETYKAAANFLLRTDYGDYSPNKSVGCNLGSFIGKLNTPETHDRMRDSIQRGLVQTLFNSTDIDTTVVFFDINEVLCVINIGGSYLIDGVIQTVNNQNIAYTFPCIGSDGQYLTPITID